MLQQNYSNINTTQQDKQNRAKRNLSEARIKQQKKQKHTEKMTTDIKSGRANIYESHKNTKQAENDKKQNIRKLQNFASQNIKDEELRNISDSVGDVFTSSKVMMPVKVAKLAFDSRAALKDYGSKWWIVAFIMAGAKDGLLDLLPSWVPFIGWIPGWAASLYLLIFLFGGGFVRKYLKGIIGKMAFCWFISLIPYVNMLAPEAVIAVAIRWRASKKAAEKAKKNLKQIQEHYSQYDV